MRGALASLRAGRGFTKENSRACISVCRDMLAVGLTHSVNETWGDAVDGSSIAGFLALGKTGLATLVQHAPPGYGQPGSFAAPPGRGAAGGQAPQQHQDQQQSPALSLNFGENMVSSLLDDDNDVPF